MRSGEVSNYAEDLALRTVIEPAIQASALTRVFPNHPVSLSDGTVRFVDFAIVSDRSRIAIEIDGYTYHAEGAITKEQFNDQLDRQNELVLQGWIVLRFSFLQVRDEADKCVDQLRRLIVSDPQLHRNFTTSSLQPSALQIEALAALQIARATGRRRGLVALPTGTGKTVLSALDAKAVGGKVLFVVHNNEILRQAAAAYKRVFPEATIGFINSEHPEKGFDEDLVFANIASLRSPVAYERFKPDHFSYIVLDEFHHGAAPSYLAPVKYFNPKFMLGLTATPERTDRRDVISLLDGNLLFSISTSTAINRGFLVPFTYFGLHDNVDYSAIKNNGYRYDLTDLERSLLIPSRDRAVVEKYIEHARDRKCIGFCVSITHAERMVEVFCAAGIPSTAIHSGLPRIERARRISLYERGLVTCVFVRDLFNEGVDFPDTASLLFLRPTESKVIFLQQLGRGLRLSPTKTNVVVLDFIGNYIGAAEIPGLLRSICTGETHSERSGKPQFTYENGCSVYFSEKTIENITVADFRVVDRSAYVEKLFVLRERIGRLLTPLDVYIEIGDDLGHLIRAFGGFQSLVDRMNGLCDDGDVLDERFAKFDPSTALLEGGSIDFLEDHGAQVLDVLESIVENIRKGGKVSAARHKVRYADAVNAFAAELLTLLAPLCLMRNTVSAFAKDLFDPGLFSSRDLDTASSDFLIFLGRKSSRRNSVAVANFLRAEFGLIAAFAAFNDRQIERNQQNLLVVLDTLLERKSLRWLSDLHDLTSYESLHH